MNKDAKSSHRLPIDETVRTRDELAEILTLVQTGTSRRIPILLVQRYFWDGLPGHPSTQACHRRVR
jgi:hypothetical protein